MNEDRFWILISRKLAGEASRAELTELDSLLQQNKDWQQKAEALTRYWRDRKDKSTNIDEAWLKTYARISGTDQAKPTQKSRTIFSHLIRYAAVFIFLIAAASLFYFYTNQHSSEQQYLVHENKKGERSQITLSDGTVVWLNVDSKITYPRKFNGSQREVELIGEAFFEVAKDSLKPFVIDFDLGKVKVLGTSFNVKAFAEDELVETSVLTGMVAFIPQKSAQEVILTPNQKAVYSKTAGTIQTASANSEQDIAWREGKLVFRAQSFAEIAKTLERTFNKRIIFENETIKNCRLTGTFQDNQLEEVIHLLAKTNDYEYEISEEVVTIKGRGCMADP